MTAPMYDVIVVGLGGMGSAAAYHLAKRGVRVLGLERYDIPHEMGSSHGLTRIIRKAYWEHPDYVPLITRAFELWDETQAAAGEPLLIQTGSLDIGPAGSSVFEGSRRSCELYGLEHQVLNGTELSRRFPGYQYPADTQAVLQPDGGFLLPERCIVAHATLAMRHGATLQAQERVLGWEAMSWGVRVTTDRGVYDAGRLILSTGAWISEFVPQLRGLAVPERQVIGWFAPKTPELFTPQAFPVFNAVTDGVTYYGFPMYGVPGFKLGRYRHLREVVNPDDMDRMPNRADEALLLDYTQKHFPQAAGTTLMLKVCLFTNTPDEHFVIDTLPGHPEVIFASPCSGHGFKFSAVVGEILADLATKGETTPAADFLKLARLESGAALQGVHG